MPNTILVPLDGSGFAEHALPVAMDIARRTHARLHLVQVHERIVGPAHPASVAAYAEWERALEQQEEEYLRSVVNRCMEAGVVARAELLQGSPASALASYAQDLDIGLIVMTTHGRGGISRAWVGSVADALVRRASVPVLLLRPRSGNAAVPDDLLLRHVLIPVDGSVLSERIIEPAVQLGALCDARYTLLRIMLPAPVLARLEGAGRAQRELAERDRRRALEQLEAAAQPLHARGFDVQTVVVHDPMPAAAILEFAAENAVDLVALATRGRGGWSRVALGSVADKVMRGSVLPVLLYGPAAPVTVAHPEAEALRETRTVAEHAVA